jgi:hypothetical protein
VVRPQMKWPAHFIAGHFSHELAVIYSAACLALLPCWDTR